MSFTSVRLVGPCKAPLPTTPLSDPSRHYHGSPPSPRPSHYPPGRERAAGRPGFYLLLSVRRCAPVSPAAPLHDGRLRSLEQSQRRPAVSGSGSEKSSGCLRLSLTATPGGKGTTRREEGGRNTIKMSCVRTDQSLPTSHVQELTWMPDKWRLEEETLETVLEE